MRSTLVRIGVVVLASVGLSLHADPTTAPTKPSLDLLADYLTGHFSSKKQSEAQPSYFDIHLHASRIWNDRADGPWIYIEQARGDMLDQPYRQRVYQLSLNPQGEFVSEVFELPGTPDEVVAKFAGAWKDDAKLKDLTPQQLKKKDGCAVYLTYADGAFNGSTRGQGCGSSRPDVKYITSEVHAEATGLRTWDRGFDGEGKQTMGAVAGPYVFDRVAD